MVTENALPSPETPRIELRDARVSAGGKILLRDLDWTLHRGEHWLVSGANGAGKSTFLRTIAGEQPIEAGGSGIRRYDLTGGGDDDLRTARSRIGYLSPERHERLLRMELPISVAEMIASGITGALYPVEEMSEALREAVEAAAAAVRIVPLLDRPMTRLSFGEFRRALAARALIVRPDVLILDEFGHGLDTASRAAMEAALVGAAAAGTSLVVSTHRTRDVPPPITDELTIEGGTIARRGPYVRTQPVYRHAADVARHDAGDDARPAVIRLRGVDVYGDNEGEKILDGLNWTLRAGERWLVSGPNGAGKSTLAKLLYGRLRAAYGGNVERFGSGANHSVERIRSDVALISDDEQLRYDWSIPVEDVIASGFFQSVGLLRHPDDAQRSAAARLMHDFGIEHLLGRRFLELSFGERRMVLVARALVRVPQLLILDEALNGFDRRSRERIMRRVEQLAGAGTAVVFIGHDENDVPPWIDRELRLDAGRIASAGRRAALS